MIDFAPRPTRTYEELLERMSPRGTSTRTSMPPTSPYSTPTQK